MIIKLLFPCIVTLLFTATQVRADLMIFTSRAAFDTAAGSLAGFESFEGASFFALTSKSFTGFSVTGQNLQPVGFAGVSDGSRSLFSQTAKSPSATTFNFDSPINAFGIDIQYTQNGSIQVGGDLSASFTLTGNQTTFFGMINTMGTFDTVSFSDVGSGTGSNPSFCFDAASFGTTSASAAVPEPSCLALVGIGAGVASIGAARRRRREQQLSTKSAALSI